MPHQCIRCGKEHPEGSDALLKGCSCGARFFLFYKEKLPDGMKINNEERMQLLENIQETIQENKINAGEKINEKINENSPVKKDESIVIDLESIKMTKQGKYEIDLAKLFARNPVIYKIGDGKYTIDIDSTFKLMKKR